MVQQRLMEHMMPRVTAPNTYTLTLFGIKTQKISLAAQTKQLQKVPSVEKAQKIVAEHVGTIAANDGEHTEWAKAYLKLAEKIYAEAEAYDLREKAFEEQNGFRREVNEGLVNLHNQIASGRFGGYSLATYEQAVSHVRDAIASMATPMRVANGIFDVSDQEAQARAANEGSRELEIALAAEKDQLQASEMNIFIYGEIFRKTFNLDEKAYVKQDGAYLFQPFELKHHGKTLATMSQDQILTVYNRDGSVAAVDDYSDYVRI